MPQTRQLAAIMFTDIVGYTALMDEDEQKAFELLKKNRQLQRPIIERYNGRWLKEIGDGVLASFKTITDAVYAAQEIQKACEAESDLKLRIGIHQGEVVFDGEDVFGSGVNIASRLEPLAPIGGILVSQSIHNNVRNIKNISTEFFGERQLRGVKEPVKVYQVQGMNVTELVPLAVASSPKDSEHSVKNVNTNKQIIFGVAAIIIMVLGYFYYSSTYKSKAENIVKTEVDKSIAVLPFKSLSADPEKQYLADGVMDAILLHLSKIENLRVITRTSVEQYRNSTMSIPEIAAELNVDHVLEGSFQKFGDQANLIVQLSNAQQQEDHIWANEYNRDWSNIFEVQSEVAKQVASELKAELTPSAQELIGKVPTHNLVAYDYYLRGKGYQRQYFITRSDVHYESAIELFEQSLQNDPEFALALVGIAETYYNKEYFKEFLEPNPLDTVPILCNQAISIDPSLAAAYALRGQFNYRVRANKKDALKDLEKALDLEPNLLNAHLYLADMGLFELDYPMALKHLHQSSELVGGGDLHQLYQKFMFLYMALGQLKQAQHYVDNILRLEPDNLVFLSSKIYLNLLQGKSRENIALAEKILMLDQSGAYANTIALTYMFKGDYEAAERYFEKYHSLSSDKLNYFDYDDLHMYSYVLRKNGKTTEAALRLRQVEEYMLKSAATMRPETRCVGYELAKIYAELGEREEAIKWYRDFAERCSDEGLNQLAGFDPLLAPLVGDAEFESIRYSLSEKIEKEWDNVKSLEMEGPL